MSRLGESSKLLQMKGAEKPRRITKESVPYHKTSE
jgi:hypothetical protein